jgi:hypothetical protein
VRDSIIPGSLCVTVLLVLYYYYFGSLEAILYCIAIILQEGAFNRKTGRNVLPTL